MKRMVWGTLLPVHYSLASKLYSLFPPPPLVQFLSKRLGADTIMFGYLESTFSFGMLIGGPLFGRFGDVFGARMALTLALVSSSTTYFILSAANSIPLLFLSRIPGVFMHVFHGAQMVMTDVSGADGMSPYVCFLCGCLFCV